MAAEASLMWVVEVSVCVEVSKEEEKEATMIQVYCVEYRKRCLRVETVHLQLSSCTCPRACMQLQNA